MTQARIKMEGMIAENKIREMNGEALAYTSFQSIGGK